jgi:Putative Actinobacterial Holin-X, holin superfamily III
MTRIEPDPTEPKQPDKSLGELFGDLSQEFADLVRTQTELARSEMRAQADKAKRVAGAFGAAAITGYMALVMLSFAAAWGLSEIVPEGIAFLIVGVLYAVAAAVLYVRGRDRAKDMSLVPQDTVESLKEDVQWARQKMS